MTKINVAILFGGKSAEHEVSLQSAKNIIDALDKEKYNPVLIGISKSGSWFLHHDKQLGFDEQKAIDVQIGEAVALMPQSSGTISHNGGEIHIDVAFPILHGTFGEDGTVQGLLKLANIPFVGAGVLGSAVGMDKDVMKRLLRDAGIPIGKFLVCKAGEELPTFSEVEEKLGTPVFIKPANMGSSVGVSKVCDASEYEKAVEEAFAYDTKIIIEEFIKGREVECAVLGNENPIASLAGEIIPSHDFYSYEAKYIDEKGAALEIPAQVSDEVMGKIQQLAIKTFKTLSCEGMGRVDCFLKDDGEVIVNEINTIPGFTKISMYPKLWEATGIPYAALIDRLIALAIDRFAKEQRLKTNYFE